MAFEFPENHVIVENLGYTIKAGDFYNSHGKEWFRVSQGGGLDGFTIRQIKRKVTELKIAIQGKPKPRFENPRPFPHGY